VTRLGIFAGREARARGIVVLGIFRQRTAEMRFPEHQAIVKVVVPDGTDQSLHMPILPSSAWRSPIGGMR